MFLENFPGPEFKTKWLHQTFFYKFAGPELNKNMASSMPFLKYTFSLIKPYFFQYFSKSWLCKRQKFLSNRDEAMFWKEMKTKLILVQPENIDIKKILDTRLILTIKLLKYLILNSNHA